MNALRLKFWVALAVVIFAIAVPGVIASHSVKVVRAEHERSEASSQSLSSFQRLAVLGYTLQQERYVNPEGFAKDRQLYIDGVRSHVINAERYINAEIKILGETALRRKLRAAAIEEEVHQREMLHKIGASLERSLSGTKPDTLWEDLVFEAIKVEEREAKEYRRNSVEAIQGVMDTLSLTVSVVAICGLLAVFWGQRQIIRPLGNLWRGTQALAAGDYHQPVPVVGTTEFRTIAESFNAMAARVAEAADDLRQTNEELERAVARRTAQLAATNRSLERANRLRQQFLADASHELRTPLSIMRSEAEITLRDADAQTEDLRAGLDRIVRLSELMGEMIDDMLHLARAEEPMLQTSIEPVDAVAAVRQSIDDFHRVIEADGGSIVLRNAPPTLIVEGDEMRLKQVMRIVVDNAVCYSTEAPKVEVAVETEDDHALIVITDHGDGIPSEDMPFLFQRFRRGSKQTGSGQGLGLSIARSMTEAMGGTLSLSSKINVGKIVTIRLPLMPAKAMADG